MENILNLVTINDYKFNEISSLNLTNFSFRICDTTLPQDSSEYMYVLISIQTQDYIYIGDCNNIISRLNQDKSGHESSSATPFHRRPYAIMGFICYTKIHRKIVDRKERLFDKSRYN